MKGLNFLLSLIYTLLKCFVLTKLYNWFVFPITNYELTMWQVWGLLLIMSLIKLNSSQLYSIIDKEKDDKKEFLVSFSMVLLALLTLGLGYICSLQ